ncbi:UNVERIFIED_CONTAM: hypothetical protein GTU68_013981 [Idotea baltica]|jgi:hypothetical protein
MTMK